MNRSPSPAKKNTAAASAVGGAAERVIEGVKQGLAQFVTQVPDEALLDLARITGAWGVKGWIKLAPFSADADALQESQQWFVLPTTGKQAGPKLVTAPLKVQVKQLKPQGDAWVAQLEGIEDRDWAQALRGATLALPRSAFPALDDGEFYWVDLIGLTVRNREGLVLGVVSELLSNGPQSVLVVQDLAVADSNEDANQRAETQIETADTKEETKPIKEHLIPFVDQYVDEVHLDAKTIVVDWQPDY